MTINDDVRAYNDGLATDDDKAIAALVSAEIDAALPDAENKVWHRHPVWFLEGNPIVGYVRRKHHFTVLFWSGQGFDEPALHDEGSFKAAEARYTRASDVDVEALRRWLQKSREIQWDYKNIAKKKGVLDRLK